MVPPPVIEFDMRANLGSRDQSSKIARLRARLERALYERDELTNALYRAWDGDFSGPDGRVLDDDTEWLR